MKHIEHLSMLALMCLGLVLAYYATRHSFNDTSGSMMGLVDFLMGFLTYAVYLCVAASLCSDVHKWFKTTHWDKLEELKKVKNK